ncbi:MAG: ComF family protein [Bacteroidales bacterium]
MGILDLFFPQVCPVCGRLLVGGEKIVCLSCLSDIPFSYFWSWRDNPAELLLRERLEVETAVTLLLYRKESNWKEVIHNFKYSGDKASGRYLSSLLGKKIVESGCFSGVDILVPVPLHPLKKWKRGFNQASVIAREIGRQIGKPVVEDVLRRGRYSSTQTIKDRKGRKRSVEGAFFLKNPERFSERHILLVDDVLTTGATIEACGTQIYKAGGVTLSVATLAFVE